MTNYQDNQSNISTEVYEVLQHIKIMKTSHGFSQYLFHAWMCDVSNIEKLPNLILHMFRSHSRCTRSNDAETVARSHLGFPATLKENIQQNIEKNSAFVHLDKFFFRGLGRNILMKLSSQQKFNVCPNCPWKTKNSLTKYITALFLPLLDKIGGRTATEIPCSNNFFVVAPLRVILQNFRPPGNSALEHMVYYLSESWHILCSPAQPGRKCRNVLLTSFHLR